MEMVSMAADRSLNMLNMNTVEARGVEPAQTDTNRAIDAVHQSKLIWRVIGCGLSGRILSQIVT